VCRNEIPDSSSIYFEVWTNLGKITTTGENISSGLWKTCGRSPSVTAFNKMRQREARWQVRDSRNGMKGLWCEME